MTGTTINVLDLEEGILKKPSVSKSTKDKLEDAGLYGVSFTDRVMGRVGNPFTDERWRHYTEKNYYEGNPELMPTEFLKKKWTIINKAKNKAK